MRIYNSLTQLSELIPEYTSSYDIYLNNLEKEREELLKIQQIKFQIQQRILVTELKFKKYMYTRHRRNRLKYIITYSPFSNSIYIYGLKSGKCVRVSDHDCDSFNFKMKNKPDLYMFIDVRKSEKNYSSTKIFKFLK